MDTSQFKTTILGVQSVCWMGIAADWIKQKRVATEVIHGSETKQADSDTQRPKGWLS